MADQSGFDREEFIRFWKKRDKFMAGWRGGLFLVFYIAGLLLFALSAEYFEDNKNLIFMILWIPLFFGYLILSPLICLRIFAGKADKRFLKCPRCNRAIRYTINRMIIVASGRCGFCGEEVFTKSPEGEK